MEKLKFSIVINAPAALVWDVLWNDKSYREWTSVFSDGSYAESEWTEGSEILFLSGEGDGMFSTIATVEPNRRMSFRHDGMIKDGIKQPIDEATKKWSGAMENYTLKESNNQTTLVVDLDIEENSKEHFNKIFPKALEKVKELAEKHANGN